MPFLFLILTGQVKPCERKGGGHIILLVIPSTLSEKKSDILRGFLIIISF